MTPFPREFAEMMLRAPAVPDWFIPTMPEFEWEMNEKEKKEYAIHNGSSLPQEYIGRLLKREGEEKRQKTIQWPSYYAMEVFKATGEDRLSKGIIPFGSGNPEETVSEILRKFLTNYGEIIQEKMKFNKWGRVTEHIGNIALSVRSLHESL